MDKKYENLKNILPRIEKFIGGTHELEDFDTITDLTGDFGDTIGDIWGRDILDITLYDLVYHEELNPNSLQDVCLCVLHVLVWLRDDLQPAACKLPGARNKYNHSLKLLKAGTNDIKSKI